MYIIYIHFIYMYIYICIYIDIYILCIYIYGVIWSYMCHFLSVAYWYIDYIIHAIYVDWWFSLTKKSHVSFPAVVSKAFPAPVTRVPPRDTLGVRNAQRKKGGNRSIASCPAWSNRFGKSGFITLVFFS